MKHITALIVTFLILPALAFAGNPYTVVNVLSGDTIELQNGEVIQMLGIDSPDIQPTSKMDRDVERTKETELAMLAKGKQAREFTKQLLDGKEVRLAYDVLDRDSHGRLLANVYIKATPLDYLPGGHRILINDANHREVFVNATIINSGYAFPLAIPPNLKNADYFLELFKDAKKNKRGFWK